MSSGKDYYLAKCIIIPETIIYIDKLTRPMVYPFTTMYSVLVDVQDSNSLIPQTYTQSKHTINSVLFKNLVSCTPKTAGYYWLDSPELAYLVNSGEELTTMGQIS